MRSSQTCKSLFDGIKRETIAQSADKRVALECLVIKELLADMKCLWKWISSERQLADGMTKIAARQNFIERFRGHHVQLVSDESFTAAKKKTKEERMRTIQETMGSTSTAAASLVALVMNENIKTANGETQVMKYDNKLIMDKVCGKDYGGMAVTMAVTILVIFAIAMFWHRTFFMDKFKELFRFVFVLKEIPQRILGRQLRELQEKVADLEKQIEFQEKDRGSLLEIQQMLEEQIQDQTEDLGRSNELVQNLQMAINGYQRERDQLRMQLARMEVSRYEIHVTRHGRVWHLNPECTYLQNAGVTRLLQPCTGCTG